MTVRSEPVGGNRRTRSGRIIYGRDLQARAKPAEDLYMPGLTAEKALAIAGLLATHEVAPAMQRWSMPNCKLLPDRKAAITALEQCSSPVARAAWSLVTPYVGRACLGSMQHAKPNRDPYESLADADERLGVRSVLRQFQERRPAFAAIPADATESFIFQQSTATAGLPVVMRTLPVLLARRDIVIGSPDQSGPSVRSHVARLALHSAFVLHAEWQDMVFDTPPEHGDEIAGASAQTINDLIATREPDVLAPIASSLVLTQAWPIATNRRAG